MSETDTLIDQAVGLARSGRLRESADLCRRILEQNPDRPEPHLMLGLAAAQEGEADTAVGHLRRYLRDRPSDPNALYNLGVVLQLQGSLSEAADAYQRALRVAPEMVPAIVNLAAVERRRGRDEAATKLLRRKSHSLPAAAELQAAYARDQQLHGDLEGAEATLLQAMQRTPGSVVLARQLADLYQACGRSPQAREVLDRARAQAPDDPTLVVAYARLLISEGDPGLAGATMDRALADHPRLAEGWSVLAVARQAMGDGQGAIAAAERSVELEPGVPRFQFNLAALLSKRTDTKELRRGREAAQACLALDPDHAAAQHCLGLIQAKLGELEAATASLRRAVELEPARAKFGVSLGDHLARIGDLEAATASLKRAEAESPRSPEPPRQLGIVQLKRDQPEAALNALERSLGLDPRDQRAIAHRAVALQHLGRHQEAEDYLGSGRHIHRIYIDPPEGFETVDELNRQLAHDIAHHSLLRWEPVGLAARNGALTEELLADRTPAILGFAGRLRQAIDQLRAESRIDPKDPFLQDIPSDGYELNVWATLVEGGGNIDTHIHEESWLSGAYYVALPSDLGPDESDPAGWIEFGRPHADIPLPEGARIDLIRPEPGLLLLFPSYLFHRTIPHRSDERRISISFDLVPR